MTLLALPVVVVIAFVAGVLVGRRNPKKVEFAVAGAKAVAADAQKAVAPTPPAAPKS